MTVKLDHIVVSARTRMEGGAHVARATGCEMGLGGEHIGVGTHNLLCTLGGDVFLEAIALDPKQKTQRKPLWYGLDTPPDPPRLSAWVLNTDDIDGTLAAARDAGVNLGTATPTKRGDITWQFAFPPRGNSELGGAAPYLMQWDQPVPHPANGMADPGLRLSGLTIATPEADMLTDLLDALDFRDPRVKVEPDTRFRLTAALTGPNGQALTLT